MSTCDVAVLGAGIVGAACARALAISGLRVTVLDRGPVGGGATAASMGHLVVMDDSEAQFALTRFSQRLWDGLSPRLPADCEFVKAGTLWVAADGEEIASALEKHAYYQARGVATEILDAKAVGDAEPNLRSGLVGGLRVPGDSVIYPPCAARWLLEDAKRNGAEVRLGEDVTQIDSKKITLRNGAELSCAAIVHATGAWASKLAPSLPIRPRKGHLVITDRYPGFLQHQIVELGYLKSAHGSERDSVAFNVQPRRTGQLLLGSSRQFDVENRDVEPQILQRMIARGLQYMPRLASLSAIRVWTGFRAATPDSLPLIGTLPGRAGHLLAVGHEGLGITTSLGTAELIACHVTGRLPPIPVEAYLPGRFAERGAHA
jgi:glycine/D-amino acid oxidase-like deaminating enzyme